MKRFFNLLVISLIVAVSVTSCGNKDYESVKNDPIKTRIYTLDNGLKVYMSVNKDEPRIQANIAVKVGSKNDPAETTGLSHYLEHLMFKGTQKYGTSNYELEKPMLDQIEQLFEVYRKTTDPAERAAIYHQIDSISYEASKISIPNEYDKLMSAIGADGTNAYTSNDVTCYVEEIPSNQIENWAKIQADRFENAVFRGFHTELEAVYEEYNMSLTQDGNLMIDTLFNALFPNHPYGTQTTLGRQEHLKNPSLTNIKKHYNTYYVPNNMAICLSGDFDPEEALAIIKKYFGELKPNTELPKWEIKEEAPITEPIEKVVIGQEAANVALAWRLPAANHPDADVADLVSSLLYNGQAGVFDLNLVQKQKVLDAYAFSYTLADQGAMVLDGYPKEGQSLEEVRDLLLENVAKLRSGDFDESLLKATIANFKLQQTQMFDENYGRVNAFVDCFVNDIPWEDEVNRLDRLAKITKDDVIKFANQYMGEKNYVVVYKREGEPNFKKIDKPQITPIVTNRDTSSQFLREIQNSEVKPIEPVFVDFNKDMEKTSTKAGLPVLYKKNETTDVFDLIYVFDLGTNNDATLSTAFSYLDYLGTSTKTPEEIKSEFYNIACNMRFIAGPERSYIMVSGLNENMEKAMTLMEEFLADPKADDEVLAELKNDIFKSRSDNKLSQSYNFYALRRYAMYGEDFIKKTVMPNEALAELTSETLLNQVKNLLKKEHTVLYYGPEKSKNVITMVDNIHKTPEKLEAIPETVHYTPRTVESSKVYVAQYDAKQIYYAQYANRGIKFDVANDADINLYNEYFGGNMGSIVFQEMREARALAYSANAYFAEPSRGTDPYYFMAFIATQNDKMKSAIEAFAEIIDNMPESEAAFDIAKNSIISRMRTQRCIKDNVLWSYMDACDMGVDYDRNKVIFEKLQNMTLADVKAFQEKMVKNSTYTYCVLGDLKDIDTKYLSELGPMETVDQKTIFGY
ncbi:MAG: insulinase family protein [Bacteroidales bacterium]|nr:insulinase family protein [Bacteroidales bacterium]